MTGAAKFKSIDEFLGRFQRVKQTGANEWTASCPCETHKHGDRSRSLSIKLKPDGETVLLNCFIGDSKESIVAAAGLTLAHLYLQRNGNGAKPREGCTYSYQDEAGRELYQKIRLVPKNFYQRRRVNGQWVTELGDVRRVPYHLPTIMLGGGVLCFAEGEKDADTLTAAGFRATSSKNWRTEWTDLLPPNTSAVIFRDRDADGEKFATACAGLLWGKVASLKMVELPGTAHDISDWFAAGGNADALRGLIDLTPEWVNAPKTKPGEPEIAAELESLNMQAKGHLRFFWERYLPIGVLIHAAGKSTEAKSPLWLDIAARISAGADFPDGAKNTLGPRSVLLLSSEDDPATTIRPRAELAGANLAKLYNVKMKVTRDGVKHEKMFSLATDLQKLLDAAAKLGDLALIIIDPITNYLGSDRMGPKMNSEERIRELLMPLAQAAHAGNFSVVTIGHLNRREKGTDPLARIMGAAAFGGIARFIYFHSADPDDADKFAHVLVQHRPKAAPSLRYRTYAKAMEWDGESSDVVGVEWRGESSANAEDAVDAAGASEKSQVATAAKRLTEMIHAAPSARLTVTDAKANLKDMGSDTEALNWFRILKAAKAESKKFSGEKVYSVFLPASDEWFKK